MSEKILISPIFWSAIAKKILSKRNFNILIIFLKFQSNQLNPLWGEPTKSSY